MVMAGRGSDGSVQVRVRIVAFNDVYSLEHLPRMATLIEEARTVNPADHLFVTLAGDFLAPSLLSSLDGGRGMVACLNALGVTHVCFGNHENDLDLGELRARMGDLSAVWLNANMAGFEASSQPSAVVTVTNATGAAVRVGLLGVVLDDPAAYLGPPFGGAVMADPNATVLRVARALLEEHDCAVVVPLTHQTVAADRVLAAELTSAKLRVPVILGGHEHAVFEEKVGNCWLLKAGSEAARAFVVDLVLDTTQTDSQPSVSVHLQPVSTYAESPFVRALVDRHLAPVRSLGAAHLCELPPGQALSSVGTRSRQTTLGTFLCDAFRDALSADACVFNGGGIRASKTYTGSFKYGDLAEELPFNNVVVVASVPGAILQEALTLSRSAAPEEAGRFLQVDSGLVLALAEPTGGLPPPSVPTRIVSIGGEPFDPLRDYRVASVRELFFGMDNLEPFLRMSRARPTCIPPNEAGREGKMILVDAFAKALWRSLGTFAELDRDGDGRVSAAELQSLLEPPASAASPGDPSTNGEAEATTRLVFGVLDTNNDGHISQAESAAATPSRRSDS
jgi:2',3'-cyclic-nucleotide 2'-phosphodiesterase (5'-nucleotidase family)